MSTASTVLITGGNRGIGLALTQQLSQRGERVIVACRQGSDELNALANDESRSVQVIENLDVRSPQTLEQALKDLGVTKLDLLINNAGLLVRDSLSDLDYNTIQAQFDINTLGPLKVTEVCLPFLVEGSKVANVSSRMGSVTDNTSGGMYGYRISKAALNMASMSLAKDLAPQGIAVIILHPGYVRTGMTGHNGLIDTDESAQGLIKLIDELSLETSGQFWHTNGEALPW
jgi:NAD(P)-dependent dehydrogenase (short-subunit alcohol dehydrogenase family)